MGKKLHSLTAENFAGARTLEIVFYEGVTRLVGTNGEGKTRILTALWACLNGIAEHSGSGALIGKRYQFIGSEKNTADLKIVILDTDYDVKIKVKRSISEKSNGTIKIEAPDGYVVDKKWASNLLSMAFLSSTHFTALSPQAQALALGINTQEYDVAIKELKSSFTQINRELSQIGEPDPVAPAEEIKTGELLNEMRAADKHNGEQDEKARLIDEAENEIMKLSKLLDEKTKALESLGLPGEKIDTTELDNQLAGADDINLKAKHYLEYVDKKAQRNSIKKRISVNQAEQRQKIKERLDYIQDFNLPLDGLTIDEDGGLLLHGRYLKQPEYSRGEIETIVADLFLSTDPSFKVRFLDDFEVLDPANQDKIIKKLLEKGFQVITAEVDHGVKKDNSIMIRECSTKASKK